MPTYEYVCTDCAHHWEEVQKISEAPLEVCPNCAKKTAKRQISGGNFILKGGGWYADLYSSSSKKSDSSSSSTSTSSSSSSTSSEPSKSETKPSTPPTTPSSGGNTK